MPGATSELKQKADRLSHEADILDDPFRSEFGRFARLMNQSVSHLPESLELLCSRIGLTQQLLEHRPIE